LTVLPLFVTPPSLRLVTSAFGLKRAALAARNLLSSTGYPVRTADLPSAFVSKESLVKRRRFPCGLRAPSQKTATAFHQTALEHGGRDNGGVGFHPEHGPNYFAAFVLDPDGYQIEAVVDEKA
jgi:hypothetical protein